MDASSAIKRYMVNPSNPNEQNDFPLVYKKSKGTFDFPGNNFVEGTDTSA